MSQGTASQKKDNIQVQEDINLKDILRILDKHNEEKGTLIAILEEIQTEYGYLPENVLRTLAYRTGRSLVDIYGVATFYSSFSLKPKGKHLICACLGTACHVRGAAKIVEELEQQIGIKPGQTTIDKEFTLETVKCLGACALGPVVVIDGHYFPKVKKLRVGQLLDEARKGLDRIDISKDKLIFPIEVSCPRCNRSFKDESFAIDGLPSIKVTVCSGKKKGWFRLSCLYGSYNVSAEHKFPLNMVMGFFCPHCHRKLLSTSYCPMCGATMIPMLVQGGGILQICSRYGCKYHMLDLV